MPHVCDECFARHQEESFSWGPKGQHNVPQPNRDAQVLDLKLRCSPAVPLLSKHGEDETRARQHTEQEHKAPMCVPIRNGLDAPSRVDAGKEKCPQALLLLHSADQDAVISDLPRLGSKMSVNVVVLPCGQASLPKHCVCASLPPKGNIAASHTRYTSDLSICLRIAYIRQGRAHPPSPKPEAERKIASWKSK